MEHIFVSLFNLIWFFGCVFFLKSAILHPTYINCISFIGCLILCTIVSTLIILDLSKKHDKN